MPQGTVKAKRQPESKLMIVEEELQNKQEVGARGGAEGDPTIYCIQHLDRHSSECHPRSQMEITTIGKL